MDENAPGQPGKEPDGPEELDPMLKAAVEAVYDSPTTLAKELFKTALVPSVQSICQIAMHGENPKLRFEAAKYVVERNLGKLADKLQVADMWEDLFSQLEAGQGG